MRLWAGLTARMGFSPRELDSFPASPPGLEFGVHKINTDRLILEGGASVGGG